MINMLRKPSKYMSVANLLDHWQNPWLRILVAVSSNA